MSWPKGSKWRKWDLHVHSPASYKFAGDWNQFIIQLGNADCDVIGINDYFSVAGYKTVLDRLRDPNAADGNKAYREALSKLRLKTLLPVVECRMNNVLIGKKGSGPRLNFHLIFSPDLDVGDIETFIRNLKVSGTSIGGRYEDAEFLRDSVSADFHEVRSALRGDGRFKDKFLVWIPYDEYGGIDQIDPKSDALFKAGLVKEADILGSSNKAQADFFLWKDSRFTIDQFRGWFDRRKPCIKGSDSHNVNDELGRLKDHESKPTDRYCWIKADPTFEGLRQIINEPEERVYIGRLPPKMAAVQQNSTHYLSEINIRRAKGVESSVGWFDCVIPLNFDMVAIIGNKGSGKSALADILAIAGNSHCDTKHYSFLTKERFCERNGRIAKQFEVEAVWADGTKTLRSLNDKPDTNAVELLKYIPQTYLERICTETEPGEQSEFQRELRKVIFSHIPEAERLNKETLDELIAYKTEELSSKLSDQREQIGALNAEIIRLEDRGSADYVAQLRSKIALKEQELRAHDSSRPAVVEPPTKEGAIDPQLAEITKKLDEERESLAALNLQIQTFQADQKSLVERIALGRKLAGRLDNFEAEYKRFLEECRPDFAKLQLDIQDVVTLAIDRSGLRAKVAALEAEQKIVANALSPDQESVVAKKERCEERMRSLQDQLDAPNKRFQAYQAQLKVWQDRRIAIEGAPDKVDTLKYLQAQLKHIGEVLPEELRAAAAKRVELVRETHSTIAAIRDVYKELFATVQKLIQDSVIIKEGFKLTFDSAIVERSFASGFFDDYVSQAVAGSFCGKDKGGAILDELRSEADFSSADEAIKFIECVMAHLTQDCRLPQKPVMEIDAQLRKHVTRQQLYDFVWSLGYLTPEYSLKLDGKDLVHLSPGERGTLLLVFYLLVDRSNVPIVVDQPEENLDNHTVYRLLIPVIKDVKKRRQIIMVTHSPNIAVVCDAEQIIHATIDRANNSAVTYDLGSIESPSLNKHLVDVLEGTRDAFDNRGSKYRSS